MYQATLKDYLRESRLFRARAITATLIILLLLLLLILHLAKLQIIDHAHFTTLSRDNRVKVEPLPPTRGLIYDRNGVILAQNLPTHSLEITPERVKDLDWTLQELGKLISISDNDRKRFNRLKSHQRRFESIPIRVQLSDEEVARFAVNRHLFPGVDIQAKLLRDYPLKDVTAHILGYVGRINKRELQTIDNSSYSGTTHIGKNGIEKYYEQTLHGKVGLQQVEINALGRVIRILESKPPEPGADLHLTLDSALQRVAIESFGEENGAAVAIDRRPGISWPWSANRDSIPTCSWRASPRRTITPCRTRRRSRCSTAPYAASIRPAPPSSPSSAWGDWRAALSLQPGKTTAPVFSSYPTTATSTGTGKRPAMAPSTSTTPSPNPVTSTTTTWRSRWA